METCCPCYTALIQGFVKKMWTTIAARRAAEKAPAACLPSMACKVAEKAEMAFREAFLPGSAGQGLQPGRLCTECSILLTAAREGTAASQDVCNRAKSW